MQVFKRFLFQEFVLTISIGLVSLVLFQTTLKNYYLPVFWILLAIISLLTGVLHYSNVRASAKKASKFATGFLMATGIKMMIYLVLITTYVLLHPEKASVFLISFFILYILYTAFEVLSILKHLRSEK
jgi:general stress protein CsbA